ncbi:hypothetical protein H6P81_019891 [Aristolochia fimbriata]|uniref:Heparanase-like protein 1 n=1 Tax=Aristolochia fimbriata TaxID=158543 RepID=A0AAV7DVZ9_ARIFI|nr:hypothetical protein H6P81_019891 [Aristolochia fimbriata]
MAPRFLLLSLLLPLFQLGYGDDVKVSVKSVTTIATTDDTFVCATLDWWPSGKCNYGQCPWGLTSILNLDLTNPILPKAIKAFNPLRIRLGGSLQDQVLYNVGKVKRCPSFKNSTKGLFGFSKGCLKMERWDQVYDLLSKSGAKISFGLNALFGRKRPADGNTWTGPWNPSNSRDFMQYTLSKGHNVDSWEFGNELCGSGIAARVDAKQYGEDMKVLKQVIDELYQNSSSKPKIMGPGGFFDRDWFKEFLEVSGPNVVDIVTHHIYNLGAGVDPSVLSNTQDPYYLFNTANTYKDTAATLKDFGPWSSAWIGESGGAYNSGSKNVSHSFVDSFWYLDQFGMTSTFSHKVFCRQTLIGGNYGLLNTTTMVPNPDYYSALLWHRLMGKRVLGLTHDGSPFLRSYCHCTRSKSGITLLFINLSNTTHFNVSVFGDMNLYTQSLDETTSGKSQREEYHLTPKDGDIQSTTMLLNGVPLELTQSGDIPELKPALVNPFQPINIAPYSIAFVSLPDFRAPACS